MTKTPLKVSRRTRNKALKLQQLVWLECTHKVLFSEPYPAMDDIIWCFKCQEEKLVIHAPTDYRVSCMLCTFSNTFGRAKLQAEIAAGKHRVQRGPAHIVEIFDGNVLVNTFGDRNQNETSMLPLSDEEPPF